MTKWSCLEQETRIRMKFKESMLDRLKGNLGIINFGKLLKKRQLKKEIASLIIEAEDQVIRTKSLKKYVQGEKMSAKCRVC